MTFESNGAGSIGTAGEKAVPEQRLEFDTTGKGGLIGLHIVNVIFMALTLMVYRFWALTRVRRAVWARMRLDGSPLEYTGTGFEIFIGFLKVFVIILLPYILISNWINSNVVTPQLRLDPLYLMFSILLGLGVAFLYAAGRYLAYRYRVNRTQWRGIRGSVGGAAYIYALRLMGYYFLTFITLGLLKPWADIKVLEYRISHTKFGGRPLSFDADTHGLWTAFLIFIVLYLMFLAAILVPYFSIFGEFFVKAFSGELNQTTFEPSSSRISPAMARFMFPAALIFAIAAALAYLNYLVVYWRAVADKIRFGRMRFEFQLTRWRVFWLYFGNALIMLFSFALLLPLTWLRKGTFLANHLRIVGDMEEESLVQAEFDTGATGDGFLGDFDLA